MSSIDLTKIPLNPVHIIMIVLAVALTVLIATFIAIDRGFGRVHIDSTAEVIYLYEKPGESYVMALKHRDREYLISVSPTYAATIKKGTILLIAEKRGRITNVVYQAWIYETEYPLNHAMPP